MEVYRIRFVSTVSNVLDSSTIRSCVPYFLIGSHGLIAHLVVPLELSFSSSLREFPDVGAERAEEGGVGEGIGKGVLF